MAGKMPAPDTINSHKKSRLSPQRSCAAEVDDEQHDKPIHHGRRGGGSAHIPQSCYTNVCRGTTREPTLPLRIHSPNQLTTSRTRGQISAREDVAPPWQGPRSTSASPYVSSNERLRTISESSRPSGSSHELESATSNTENTLAWSARSTLCGDFPSRVRAYGSPSGSPELAPRPCHDQTFEALHDSSSVDYAPTDKSCEWPSSGCVTPSREWGDGDKLDITLNQHFTQSQQQEYDSHPGHQFWEWDDTKQKWRRRGTEDEWFPEFIA